MRGLVHKVYIMRCKVYRSGYLSGRKLVLKSDRRRLGSVTLASSRVRAGYEFVSCRRYGDQRLPAGPIATAIIYSRTISVQSSGIPRVSIC